MSNRHFLNELTIEITKACPMRCLICSSDGGEPDPNELNLKELQKLVDEATTLGLKVISLSGGEPLVCPNTMNFIKYAKNNGIAIYLYTCGNVEVSGDIYPVDEKTLGSLKDLSVDKLIFSIHGPNARIHDMITIRPGSFSNLVDSIMISKSMDLPVELHFVPTALNCRYLPQTVKFAEELKVDRLSILRFVPHGRGYLNRKTLEITGDGIPELRDIISEVRASSSIDIRLGSPFNCFQMTNSSRCSAGIDKAVMRPDGYIFPCVSMKRFAEDMNGNNIREYSLPEIWNDSNVFGRVRALLAMMEHSECRDCPGFSRCRGGCLTQRLMQNENIIEGRDPYCILNTDRDKPLLEEAMRSVPI